MGGRAQRPGLGLGIGRLGGLGNEDDVHVARVIELPGAALTHGDHGQPATWRVGWQLRRRDGQRCLQRGCREVGQLSHDLVDRRGAGQIPRCDVQQPPLVPDTQRVRIGRGEHAGAQLTGTGLLARVQIAQQPPVGRVPAQVVGQRGARAEDRGQPSPQSIIGTQREKELLVRQQPGQAGEIGASLPRRSSPSSSASSR